MNSLVRWDALKELEDLEQRLSTLFGRVPVRQESGNEELVKVVAWAPLVDITEDEKEYLIKAELPEVKRDEVKVTVEDGAVSVSGERKLDKEEKGKKFHRVERAYGSFLRSFSLPDDADASRVNAEFKEGVLEVHLPKGEKAKSKTMEVKIS